MALPTYALGTVSVANGSTVVTLSGGDWSGPNARELDNISINGLGAVLVTEVTDKLHLKIPPWQGANQVNVPYVIYQSYGGRVVGVAAAKDVGSMLATLRVAALAPIFAFEGDSLTDVVHEGTWPTYLPANFSFFNRGTVYQFAVGGDTASAMVGEYPTQAGSITIQPGQEAYYFLWAGTNDIVTGASAATIYGNLTTIWAAARASGYKVVAFTIMRRGDATSGQNDVRIALNALILSNPSLYDFIVRPDVYFTDPFNLNNFVSNTVHLNAAGNFALAQKVAAAVLGTAPVYAAPLDALAFNGLQLNGGMEVSQDGTAAITGIANTVVNVVDGMQVQAVGSGVLTAQQVTDAPPGLNNSIKITVTTAQAAMTTGDFFGIRLAVEGYRASRLAFGTLNAQPVSVGFWVKAHRIGLYSGALRNSAADRTYNFSYTVNVADTWEFKTITIPGDVAGAWIGNTNGVGFRLFLTIAAGASFISAPNVWNAGNILAATGTTNGVAALSDVFQVTGLFILPGIELPTSERVSRILRPFDQELSLCQRYYWRTLNAFAAMPVVHGYGAAGALVGYPLLFPGPMRATPALTFVNGGGWGVSNCAVPSAAWVDVNGFQLRTTVTALGNYSFFPSGSGDYITANARL